MKKILVIGGSSSLHSINRKFAAFAAGQLRDVSLTVLDLNDFEMPIFSVDREKEGYPDAAKRFLDEIENADGLVISLAEHNGSYSSAFKNVLDWSSRLDRNLWQNKPMLLLSTSPGPRGGANVMQAALHYFPRLGANIITNFSLPGYHSHFNGEQILDPDLADSFSEPLKIFEQHLQSTREVASGK